MQTAVRVLCSVVAKQVSSVTQLWTTSSHLASVYIECSDLALHALYFVPMGFSLYNIFKVRIAFQKPYVAFRVLTCRTERIRLGY
jgi:hypothetical protein